MNIGRIDPTTKWIRGTVGGANVVDTRSAQLVWEHPYYPSWFIPSQDVRHEGLATTSIDELPGYVKVAWDSVERWFEEDEEVFVHARSPYVRLDSLPSSRHIVVSIDGTIVADSRQSTILYETGVTARYYLPPADVRLDLLTPTNTVTACPYKGSARYWTVAIDGVQHPDIAWGYDDPLPESAPVKGLICFYNEKVDIEVDGERLERVGTPIS